MITLTKVAINKYKSIETEQTFEVDPKVTVLVGKNEAGKTAILEAIAKENYFEDDPKFKFNAVYDYPRKEKKKFDKSGQDIEVIRCTYVISKDLLKRIQDDVGTATFNATEITHARKYLTDKGTLSGVHADRKKFIEFKLKQHKVSDTEFTAKALSIESAATIKGLSADAANSPYKAFLEDVTKYFLNEWKWESNPISEYLGRVWIKPNLPKFLYYDEYYELPSEIEIKKLQSKQLDEEKLKTSKALFELADINIEDLLKDEDYEPYKAELEATSNEITATLFKYWKTNSNLRVDFDIQKQIRHQYNTVQDVNPILKIRVNNQKYQMSLPLASRSKGFNWFFSFIVWFSKIQEDKDSNYVLLLDEPGLNLHATAQEDLRNFIEDLSKDYQVIYTTHSPFMIDSSKLDRVRTVLETNEGTKVSDSIQEKDPDTLFPLQAALGYDIAQNLFISRNNLLIEGASDLLYLTVMSGVLEAVGREGLKEDVTLVPVGGLDKVTTFISLLRGQKLNIACLLDSFTDQKGKTRIQDLIQHKIIKEKNVRFFDEFAAIGGQEADIEDLFEKKEYLDIFNPAFDKKYKDVQESDLDSGIQRIIPQICKVLGIKSFNHYLPAMSLNKKGVSAADFSEATLERFEKMFEAINSLF